MKNKTPGREPSEWPHWSPERILREHIREFGRTRRRPLIRRSGAFSLGLLISCSGAVNALSLGEPELNSYLLEPLRLTVPLQDDEGLLQPLPRLLPADQYSAYGLPIPALDLREFRLEFVPGDTVYQGEIRIRTDRAVREPLLSLLLQVSHSRTAIVRQLDVLLDPVPAPKALPQPGGGLSAVPVPRQTAENRTLGSSAPSNSGRASGPEVARRSVSRAADSARPEAVSSSRSSGRDRGSSVPANRPWASDGPVSQYGPVKAGEVISIIAQRVRPDPWIPLDQMIAALYRANPAAFDGDQHHLRRGAILQVPTEAEIRSTPRELQQAWHLQSAAVAAEALPPAASRPARLQAHAASLDRPVSASTDAVAEGAGAPRGVSAPSAEKAPVNKAQASAGLPLSQGQVYLESSRYALDIQLDTAAAALAQAKDTAPAAEALADEPARTVPASPLVAPLVPPAPQAVPAEIPPALSSSHTGPQWFWPLLTGLFAGISAMLLWRRPLQNPPHAGLASRASVDEQLDALRGVVKQVESNPAGTQDIERLIWRIKLLARSGDPDDDLSAKVATALMRKGQIQEAWEVVGGPGAAAAEQEQGRSA